VRTRVEKTEWEIKLTAASGLQTVCTWMSCARWEHPVWVIGMREPEIGPDGTSLQ
jgi:hypothetical protein